MASTWISLPKARVLMGILLIAICTQARALNHRQVLDKIFAPSSSCSSEPEPASTRQIRRLTRNEYRQSVRDIFGYQANFEKDLPLDEAIFGFKNNSAANLVTIDHAIAYTRIAQKIASDLVDTSWSQLMSCSPDETCAEAFLKKFGTKIWRRPLSPTEEQTLLAVYRTGAEQNQSQGMKLLVRAFLSAPSFLYRSELGRTGQLDSYEWAAALSYFFWASTPDDELLARAADGSLETDEGLRQEIERLLASPRAKEGIKAFADNWTGYARVLQVSKDANRFPNFDAATRIRLAEETENFFENVILKRDGQFSELMAADTTSGDAALAASYGLSYREGNGRRLELAAEPRRGLLGQASILASLAYASETHPIARGKFVREHLLCEELLPPPPTLNVQPPPPKEGATTRERFAAHSSLPACKGCHVRLDGAGFGLEDFDAIGRYRTIDMGKPVDASGELVDVDGSNHPFNGGKELSEIIATSTRAERCFALQWFRMAHGRLETEGDICAVRRLGERFSSGMTIRALMIAVLSDSSYRLRRP